MVAISSYSFRCQLKGNAGLVGNIELALRIPSAVFFRKSRWFWPLEKPRWILCTNGEGIWEGYRLHHAGRGHTITVGLPPKFTMALYLAYRREYDRQRQ